MRLFLVHGVDYLDDVVAGCVPGLGLEHDQHSGLLKDQCYCDKDKNVIIIKLNNFIYRIRKLMKKSNETDGGTNGGTKIVIFMESLYRPIFF